MSAIEKKPRILIADDEEGIRESLRLILGEEYELVFTADGNQTWQQVTCGFFDLICLDVKMPKLDGFEVLRRMRAAGDVTPVLVLTAYQSIELAREAVKLGAYEYIPKPFERGHVKQLVQEALQEVAV